MNCTQDIVNEVQVLKMNKQYEKAIVILQKLICEDLSYTIAYEELGDCYLSMQEYEKSEKALKYALKLNPSSSNTHYLLGFLYSIEEKWQLSLEYLEKANNAVENNPEIIRCLGWSLHNAGSRIQGLALLERASYLSPNDPNILCDLGVCYMENDYFAKAQGVFKEIQKENPQSIQAKECSHFLEYLEKK